MIHEKSRGKSDFINPAMVKKLLFISTDYLGAELGYLSTLHTIRQLAHPGISFDIKYYLCGIWAQFHLVTYSNNKAPILAKCNMHITTKIACITDVFSLAHIYILD